MAIYSTTTPKESLSINIRNGVQSVRHRHSGVNRGGVASHTSNRSMYVKVAKNLKGREKTKIKCYPLRMVVTDDITFFY
jgi:hypothetical protein